MKTALLTALALTLLPLDDGPPTQTDPEKVGFDVLASFDYKEGEDPPEEVTKLHKKKVQISGFMTTEDGSGGDVEFFVLVNDACGCEGTPKLNEMVFCSMPEGDTTEIRPGVRTITGRLYVEEEKEDGVVISLYTLEVDKVE